MIARDGGVAAEEGSVLREGKAFPRGRQQSCGRHRAGLVGAADFFAASKPSPPGSKAAGGAELDWSVRPIFSHLRSLPRRAGSEAAGGTKVREGRDAKSGFRFFHSFPALPHGGRRSLGERSHGFGWRESSTALAVSLATTTAALPWPEVAARGRQLRPRYRR
jgi:hypothetical protein